MDDDLTAGEVTSQPWPPGTRFRPVSPDARGGEPVSLPGAAAGPGRPCSDCGAIVEAEPGAGFWVTGEDAAGARRHCTGSPDRLHHPG
jgi:hypothetical protein